MRKIISVFLLSLSLFSCQKVLPSYEKDAEKLFSQENSSFLSEPSGFESKIERKSKENNYFYRFTVFHPKTEYKEVKIILGARKDENYWFLGYKEDYTLSDSEEKNSYKGLAINFINEKEYEDFLVYFQGNVKGEAKEEFYRLSIER